MSKIIGLTGQFGSGCSTIKDILYKNFQYRSFVFSDLIKQEALAQGLVHPTRYILQNIGNQKRQIDLAYWAKAMINKIHGDVPLAVENRIADPYNT